MRFQATCILNKLRKMIQNSMRIYPFDTKPRPHHGPQSPEKRARQEHVRHIFKMFNFITSICSLLFYKVWFGLCFLFSLLILCMCFVMPLFSPSWLITWSTNWLVDQSNFQNLNLLSTNLFCLYDFDVIEFCILYYVKINLLFLCSRTLILDQNYYIHL